MSNEGNLNLQNTLIADYIRIDSIIIASPMPDTLSWIALPKQTRDKILILYPFTRFLRACLRLF